jgi:hypothetical protein
MTKHTSLNRDAVKRYLIGKVTREERTAIEEALGGDEAFNEFMVIEDQLVYDYLRGRLSVAYHRLFEGNYLNYSRRRREKVEVARALLEQSERLRMAERAAPEREHADLRPARMFNLRTVMTIVTLAVVTPLLLILFMTRSQEPQLAELEARHAEAEQQLRSELEQKEQELRRQAETEQRLRKQYAEELERERAAAEGLRTRRADAPARPQARGLSAWLSSIFLPDGVGIKGDSRIPEYPIGRQRKSLRVELELPAEREYASYSAKLSDFEGAELKTFTGLSQKMTRRGPVAVINIPGAFLKPGTYTVKLYGSDPTLGDKPIPLDSYFFSLKEK